MKKILIIGLLMICSMNVVFAQNENEIIVKASDLVKNKQYNSAFKMLNEVDRENENPQIVLRKVDILLNFYVSTSQHQKFGLKDLKENETIEQLRGKPIVDTYYKFEINSILEKLITKHPTDWDLYKTLGKYYFDVYTHYGEDWVKPQEELLDLSKQNCDIAEQNNVFDAKSLYIIGYIELVRKNYEKSVTYFLRSLEIDSNNATTNFTLAFAYSKMGKIEEGLDRAKSSAQLFDNNAAKADAYRLIATLYRIKNDFLSAIEYYKISEDLFPNNYDNLVALLELYIQTKDLKSAASIADALFSLHSDIHTLGDILGNYYRNGYKDELLKFFDRMETKFTKQDEIMGNLLFIKAFFYNNEKEWDLARLYYIEARKRFEKCFGQSHSILTIIDQKIQSVDQEIEFEKAIGHRKK